MATEQQRASWREANRRYRAAHPERVRAIQRESSNRRYREDESYRAEALARSRGKRLVRERVARRAAEAQVEALTEALRFYAEASIYADDIANGGDVAREALRRLEERAYHARSRGKRLARYGLTVEGYVEMCVSQANLCAICGLPESIIAPDGAPRGLAVDHCHATGRVRGLLCGRCNMILGSFHDDPALLRTAADYLAASNGGDETNMEPGDA